MDCASSSRNSARLMGGYLYAMQGAGLYRIDPNTGSYISLNTSDWTGSNLMSAHDGTYTLCNRPGYIE
jgi:hypothetical protein